MCATLENTKSTELPADGIPLRDKQIIVYSIVAAAAAAAPVVVVHMPRCN